MALSAGRENVLIASKASQDEVRAQTGGGGVPAALAWPGCRRLLDRESPGYDT
jgi:hypothetical protein